MKESKVKGEREMAQMINYAMKVYSQLMEEQDNLVEQNLSGQDEQMIECLTYNSKETLQNTLFICKGAAFKPEYLNEAVKNGAICYISETKYETEKEVPYIIVKDIRKAMPVLSNKFFNEPWKDINVIGIGGTKGKSTSVYYMKAVVDDYLAAQNKKDSAVISTIDIYDGVIKKESHITTPEAVELQGHIRNAVNSGMEFLQMEVSSQALKYGRVDGMMFDVAVFLNISEDHISPIEHPDFEDYFQSKLKMFSKTKTAVVNLDADFADRILEEAKAAKKVVTISTKNQDADFYAYDIKKKGNGTVFRVRCSQFDEEFELSMPGFFNVENALGIIAAAMEFDIPVEYIHSGLKRAKSSGRMELYSSDDHKVLAIVDYAHNKLSFEKLFSSIKEEYPDREIISIFGCPGKKSFLRRKYLGTIAGQYAKMVYIAAEDPGAEPVEQISGEIAKYVEAQGCPYEMIEDRGEAIKASIEYVKKPSVILITGKGNETRQKYGSEYLDCPSDVEYVKKYIAEYNERNK